MLLLLLVVYQRLVELLRKDLLHHQAEQQDGIQQLPNMKFTQVEVGFHLV
jgi:hypothetical protein